MFAVTVLLVLARILVVTATGKHAFDYCLSTSIIIRNIHYVVGTAASLVVSLLVSFFPNTSVIAICDENTLTLTCVTDTGLLIWSTPFGQKTYILTSHINVQVQLGYDITVQLTHVSGAILTSVANISGPPNILTGTVIRCKDGFPGTDVKIKTLLKPGMQYSIHIIMLMYM